MLQIVHNITAEDGDILLVVFDLRRNEGEHRIECSDIGSGTDLGYKVFFIVDSQALTLQSISPQVIVLGQSVQVSDLFFFYLYYLFNNKNILALID